MNKFEIETDELTSTKIERALTISLKNKNSIASAKTSASSIADKKERMLAALSASLRKQVRETEEQINSRIVGQRRGSYFMIEKLEELKERQTREDDDGEGVQIL